MSDDICTTPDCGRKIRARGLCVRCYTAARSSGQLLRLADMDPLVAAADRFAKHVGPATDSGCLPWLGAPDRDGYGEFWIQSFNTSIPAHRVAIWLETSDWPASDRVVDHICHDPATCSGGGDCPHRRCVNFEHLVLTDASTNCSAPRRSSPRGSAHPRARLDDDAVRAIRNAYTSGVATQVDLAKTYGVSQPLISSIVHRRTWKHVA